MALPTSEGLAKLPPEALIRLWLLVQEYKKKLALSGCGLMPASAVEDLAKAVPDDLVQAIVQDNRKGVSEPGWLPPSATGSGSEKGSGWLKPTPLEPPSGVRYVDQIADHFDRLDRQQTVANAIDRVRKLKGVLDE